jgi:hypothetical protein
MPVLFPDLTGITEEVATDVKATHAPPLETQPGANPRLTVYDLHGMRPPDFPSGAALRGRQAVSAHSPMLDDGVIG